MYKSYFAIISAAKPLSYREGNIYGSNGPCSDITGVYLVAKIPRHACLGAKIYPQLTVAAGSSGVS
jgi:hypothetical protein